MVPSASMVAMGFSLIVSVALPVGFFLYARRRRIAWRPVIAGMLVFLLFSLVLEGSLNRYVLMANPAWHGFFARYSWAIAVYGALAAAVFEEGGRYLAMRFALPGFRKWSDGLAYGIGHGGIEALIVGGLGSLSNLVNAAMINSGRFTAMIAAQPAPSAESPKTVMVALTQAPPYLFGIVGLERIMAFGLQLGLSLLVMRAVAGGRWAVFGAALLLHAGVDFFAGMVKVHLLPLWTAEGAELLGFVAAIWAIVRLKGDWAEELYMGKGA